MNSIEKIVTLGQRIWYDNISRDLIKDGRLKALVAAGVRGVTTNPSIFEKAIASSHYYDEDILRLRAIDPNPATLIRELMIADVRLAADILRGVYDRSLGQDGYVSIEVAPDKATDTQATVKEAQLLWAELARPNVMIKIPATPAGIPAIRETLRAGINVNVTLIFAPGVYEQVANAYMAALEDRLQDGQPIDRLASVASVFVSRVDTFVDRLLHEKLKTVPTAETKRIKALLGRTGMANAQRIYLRYKDLFRSKPFARLRARGARPQWPLWASTSSKDPAYSPTWYIDRLLGPDTINTVPPQTFDALLTHARPRALLETEMMQALSVLEGVRREGIDLPEALDALAEQGLAAFNDAYHALIARLGEKKDILSG